MCNYILKTIGKETIGKENQLTIVKYTIKYEHPLALGFGVSNELKNNCPQQFFSNSENLACYWLHQIYRKLMKKWLLHYNADV